MFEINRSTIVVKPKQPLVDWVRSLDEKKNESITLDCARDDANVYLIPKLLEDSEQQIVLEWCYNFVFEEELASWYTYPEVWPPHRDLKMFLEWFEVEFHSGVFDLCDGSIETYDDDLPDLLTPTNGH